MLFHGGQQHGIGSCAHDPVDYTRSIAAPVLVMIGDRDQWTRADEARAIVEVLPVGVVGQFVAFHGIAHGPLAAAAPSIWRTAVSGFLLSRFPN